MEQVPPDVAKKLLNRDFSNLIKRVQGGGKLTRAERTMLQSMAAGAPGEDSPVASNYNDLAEILGVSRQAIHAWKQFRRRPQSQSKRHA